MSTITSRTTGKREYKGSTFDTLHQLISVYPDAPLSDKDAEKVAEWSKIPDKDARRKARVEYTEGP